MTICISTEKKIRDFWHELAHVPNPPFETTYGWLHTDMRGRSMEVYIEGGEVVRIFVFHGDRVKASYYN